MDIEGITHILQMESSITEVGESVEKCKMKLTRLKSIYLPMIEELMRKKETDTHIKKLHRFLQKKRLPAKVLNDLENILKKIEYQFKKNNENKSQEKGQGPVENKMNSWEPRPNKQCIKKTVASHISIGNNEASLENNSYTSSKSKNEITLDPDKTDPMKDFNQVTKSNAGTQSKMCSFKEIDLNMNTSFGTGSCANEHFDTPPSTSTTKIQKTSETVLPPEKYIQYPNPKLYIKHLMKPHGRNVNNKEAQDAQQTQAKALTASSSQNIGHQINTQSHVGLQNSTTLNLLNQSDSIPINSSCHQYPQFNILSRSYNNLQPATSGVYGQNQTHKLCVSCNSLKDPRKQSEFYQDHYNPQFNNLFSTQVYKSDATKQMQSSSFSEELRKSSPYYCKCSLKCNSGAGTKDLFAANGLTYPQSPLNEFSDNLLCEVETSHHSVNFANESCIQSTSARITLTNINKDSYLNLPNSKSDIQNNLLSNRNLKRTRLTDITENDIFHRKKPKLTNVCDSDATTLIRDLTFKVKEEDSILTPGSSFNIKDQCFELIDLTVENEMQEKEDIITKDVVRGNYPTFSGFQPNSKLSNTWDSQLEESHETNMNVRNSQTINRTDCNIEKTISVFVPKAKLDNVQDASIRKVRTQDTRNSDAKIKKDDKTPILQRNQKQKNILVSSKSTKQKKQEIYKEIISGVKVNTIIKDKNKPPVDPSLQKPKAITTYDSNKTQNKGKKEVCSSEVKVNAMIEGNNFTTIATQKSELTTSCDLLTKSNTEEKGVARNFDIELSKDSDKNQAGTPVCVENSKPTNALDLEAKSKSQSGKNCNISKVKDKCSGKEESLNNSKESLNNSKQTLSTELIQTCEVNRSTNSVNSNYVYNGIQSSSCEEGTSWDTLRELFHNPPSSDAIKSFLQCVSILSGNSNIIGNIANLVPGLQPCNYNRPTTFLNNIRIPECPVKERPVILDNIQTNSSVKENTSSATSSAQDSPLSPSREDTYPTNIYCEGHTLPDLSNNRAVKSLEKESPYNPSMNDAETTNKKQTSSNKNRIFSDTLNENSEYKKSEVTMCEVVKRKKLDTMEKLNSKYGSNQNFKCEIGYNNFHTKIFDTKESTSQIKECNTQERQIKDSVDRVTYNRELIKKHNLRSKANRNETSNSEQLVSKTPAAHLSANKISVADKSLNKNSLNDQQANNIIIADQTAKNIATVNQSEKKTSTNTSAMNIITANQSTKQKSSTNKSTKQKSSTNKSAKKITAGLSENKISIASKSEKKMISAVQSANEKSTFHQSASKISSDDQLSNKTSVNDQTAKKIIAAVQSEKKTTAVIRPDDNKSATYQSEKKKITGDHSAQKTAAAIQSAKKTSVNDQSPKKIFTAVRSPQKTVAAIESANKTSVNDQSAKKTIDADQSVQHIIFAVESVDKYSATDQLVEKIIGVDQLANKQFPTNQSAMKISVVDQSKNKHHTSEQLAKKITIPNLSANRISVSKQSSTTIIDSDQTEKNIIGDQLLNKKSLVEKSANKAIVGNRSSNKNFVKDQTSKKIIACDQSLKSLSATNQSPNTVTDKSVRKIVVVDQPPNKISASDKFKKIVNAANYSANKISVGDQSRSSLLEPIIKNTFSIKEQHHTNLDEWFLFADKWLSNHDVLNKEDDNLVSFTTESTVSDDVALIKAFNEDLEMTPDAFTDEIYSKYTLFEDIHLNWKSRKAYGFMTTKESLSHFYKCMDRYCPFTTVREHSFTQHLQDHLESYKNSGRTQINSWKLCPYCCDQIGDVHAYVGHLNTNHGDCIVQCYYCFNRCETIQEAKVHLRVCHDKAKPHAMYCHKNGRVVDLCKDNQSEPSSSK